MSNYLVRPASELFPRHTKVEPVREKLRGLKVGGKVRVGSGDFGDIQKYRFYVSHVAAYFSTKYTTNYNRKTDILTITRVK